MATQKNPNRQFKDNMRELRLQRDDFIKRSLSKMQILRKVGTKFAKEIFDHVKLTALYGEKRYLIKDVGKYLNTTNEGKDIFIELVGGQSCFLPPLGKHKQGKLFVKNHI